MTSLSTRVETPWGHEENFQLPSLARSAAFDINGKMLVDDQRTHKRQSDKTGYSSCQPKRAKGEDDGEPESRCDQDPSSNKEKARTLFLRKEFIA